MCFKIEQGQGARECKVIERVQELERDASRECREKSKKEQGAWSKRELERARAKERHKPRALHPLHKNPKHLDREKSRNW